MSPPRRNRSVARRQLVPIDLPIGHQTLFHRNPGQRTPDVFSGWTSVEPGSCANRYITARSSHGELAEKWISITSRNALSHFYLVSRALSGNLITSARRAGWMERQSDWDEKKDREREDGDGGKKDASEG